MGTLDKLRRHSNQLRHVGRCPPFGSESCMPIVPSQIFPDRHSSKSDADQMAHLLNRKAAYIPVWRAGYAPSLGDSQRNEPNDREETIMKPSCAPNVGKTDRVIRVLLGIGLLSLTFIGPKTWWGLIGIIPLATGFVGMCPMYRLLGVDSCSIGRKQLKGPS